MKRFLSLIAVFGLSLLATQAQVNPGGGGGGGGGGGEVNTGANLGTGVGVFAGKSSTTLNFNSLVAGSNITVVSNSNNITISSTASGGNSFDTTQFVTNAASEISIVNGALATNFVAVSNLTVGTLTGVDQNVKVVGDAGRFRTINFNTGDAATNRWRMGANDASELGSESGSQFILQSYDDDGSTALQNIFLVGRGNGALFNLYRPLDMFTNSIYAMTNSTTLGVRGSGDSNTGLRWGAPDQLEFVANGNNKVQITDSQITATAPVVVSGQTVTATGFILSAASGNRPIYSNGSGQLSEASVISTAGNTNDVGTARMSLISSALASGSTWKSISSDGTISLTDQSTNIVIGFGTNYVTDNLGAGFFIPNTTNGAPFNTVQTNNVPTDILVFNDGATNRAVATFRLPENWNASTLKYKIGWTSTNTSGTVEWMVRATSLADQDSMDVTWGTAIAVTDDADSGYENYLTAASASLTVGNTPAPGDLVKFEVFREADSGSDNLGGQAQFIDLTIQYAVTNAVTTSW